MTVVVLLLTAAFVAFGPAQDRGAKPPFTIRISADPSMVKVGSGVDVEVVLKNTSAKPLDCSVAISDLTGQDPSLTFDVRDERGNLAPRRVYSYPELATGHAIVGCAVAPGETRTEGQDITRIYDITRPGVYTIQVSKAISLTNAGAGVVKSNKMTITVSP